MGEGVRKEGPFFNEFMIDFCTSALEYRINFL